MNICGFCFFVQMGFLNLNQFADLVYRVSWLPPAAQQFGHRQFQPPVPLKTQVPNSPATWVEGARSPAALELSWFPLTAVDSSHEENPFSLMLTKLTEQWIALSGMQRQKKSCKNHCCYFYPVIEQEKNQIEHPCFGFHWLSGTWRVLWHKNMYLTPAF